MFIYARPGSAGASSFSSLTEHERQFGIFLLKVYNKACASWDRGVSPDSSVGLLR